jgi:hypothetical protein
MEGVIKCYKEKFPEANIFTVKIPIDVMWGSASILEVKTTYSRVQVKEIIQY